MHKKAGLTAGALCLLLSACSFAGERVLSVYTWEAYFSPRAVQEFEKRFECKVEFDYYESNETMIESLKAGGGYDIMTPSGYGSHYLQTHGKLLPLDHALLPNMKNIQEGTPSLAHDREMGYSVPYTATITGVAYNTDMVPPDALGSWDIFADSRLAKKMTMMNDTRETIGAALKFLGYSVNSSVSREVQEAGRVVREWKENLAMFSVDEAREGLISGKYAAIQAYNGDFVHIQKDNPQLDFFVPREGSAISSDQLVIGSDTQQPGLAHAFINFFLDAEIAAMNMQDTGYFMPNAPALELLDDDFRKNPAFDIAPEILEKSEVIHTLDESRELYDQVWEEVLIG